MSVMKALSGVVENVVAAVVMLVLSVLSFFLVVYVVNVGSRIAAVDAPGGFVVLSAALIVAAGIIAGVRFGSPEA